jgi:hypothetical protein
MASIENLHKRVRSIVELLHYGMGREHFLSTVRHHTSQWRCRDENGSRRDWGTGPNEEDSVVAQEAAKQHWGPLAQGWPQNGTSLEEAQFIWAHSGIVASDPLIRDGKGGLIRHHADEIRHLVESLSLGSSRYFGRASLEAWAQGRPWTGYREPRFWRDSVQFLREGVPAKKLAEAAWLASHGHRWSPRRAAMVRQLEDRSSGGHLSDEALARAIGMKIPWHLAIVCSEAGTEESLLPRLRQEAPEYLLHRPELWRLYASGGRLGAQWLPWTRIYAEETLRAAGGDAQPIVERHFGGKFSPAEVKRLLPFIMKGQPVYGGGCWSSMPVELLDAPAAVAEMSVGIVRFPYQVRAWACHKWQKAQAAMTKVRVAHGPGGETQQFRFIDLLDELRPEDVPSLQTSPEVVFEGAARRREAEMKAKAGEDFDLPKAPFKLGDGFEQVLTYKALEALGKAEAHCVGGYWDRCMKGGTFIFSGAPTGRCVTLEVTGGRVWQAMYACNVAVTGKDREYVRAWAEARSLEFR